MEHYIAQDGEKFFEEIKSYLSFSDRQRVYEAFAMARREHGDQRRQSGELFFTHPLTVAYYLAQYRLDASALEAALLHDIAEDVEVSIEQIEAQFGPDVALLVNAVTKLKDVSQGIAQDKKLTRQELQAASLLKLFDIMTVDVRAVIIKLFDRLHNMRTIGATPEHKQREKATETRAVYAPLANRLGIWKLKNELDALALEVLHKQAFHTIKKRLTEIQQQHEAVFEIIRGQIVDSLLQADLDIRGVVLSPENIYTVYQDLVASGSSYHDVDTTMRLVILTGDWQSCYLILGHLHQIWRPVPMTFDDYVAAPRDNLYRSLHTTIIHSSGLPIKLRIRTIAMNKVSEIGILARWRYDKTPLWDEDMARRVDAFLDNITQSINIEPHNPTFGVRRVVEDVFVKQIRVHTPRGDIFELPAGATPLDLAYRIHTQLGDQCYAAEINGNPVPLYTQLNDGDRVFIIKKESAEPQRAWLDENLGYVVTNYARSHIRRWFRRLSEKTAVLHGQQLLSMELDLVGLTAYTDEKISHELGYSNTYDLYYALGRADILPTTISTMILETYWDEGKIDHLNRLAESAAGETFVIANAPSHNLRLCGTCHPRPRDVIMGYMRADGGVTIHKETCHFLPRQRLAGRTLKLEWGETAAPRIHMVTIRIDVYDRPGLLFEITHLIQAEQINIARIRTEEIDLGSVSLIMKWQVSQPRKLVRVLHQIQALANVLRVQCEHADLPEQGQK